MAATAVHMEINSFVGKFLYLSSCGYAADLSFSTSNGEVRLKFEASLGSLSYSSDEFFPTRREKPSRMRRRQQRRENRFNPSSSNNLKPTPIQQATSDEPAVQLIEPDCTPPQDIQVTQVRPDSVITTLGPFKVDAAVQTSTTSKDAASETKPAKPVILTTTVNPSHSISPRNIFHPAIINVSRSLYERHPSELSKEEFRTFNRYLHQKRNNGEPVELDPKYLPTSMRDCLHCGHPT